jgi:hypothetical protein
MGCIRELTFVALATAGGFVAEASQQSPPVLRAGVDMVTIDVQIAPVKDAKMRELTAVDFVITIAGRRRKTASVSFLHYDQGAVIRTPVAAGANGPSPECAFGFHRREDRQTAHYLVGVDGTEADQAGVKDVRISIVDKTMAVRSYVWRIPAHKGASPRVAR